MTVVIPDSFREFVSSQVASGHYSDESALVCALLQKEQAKQEREAIDQKLLQALDNGETTEMTPADWHKIRAEVQRRHGQRIGNRP